MKEDSAPALIPAVHFFSSVGLFGRHPIQKIHYFCTVATIVSSASFPVMCLRWIDVLFQHPSIQATLQWFCSPFSALSHFELFDLHPYVRRHINNLGANNVRVYSYTYEYFRDSQTKRVSHVSFSSSTFNHHSTSSAMSVDSRPQYKDKVSMETIHTAAKLHIPFTYPCVEEAGASAMVSKSTRWTWLSAVSNVLLPSVWSVLA